MSSHDFQGLIAGVTGQLAGRPLDSTLAARMNAAYPADGETFDGHPAGWCGYGPGSAHRPAVPNGAALVRYPLPQGAIEFTAA